jgi:hypothetical protein
MPPNGPYWIKDKLDLFENSTTVVFEVFMKCPAGLAAFWSSYKSSAFGCEGYSGSFHCHGRTTPTVSVSFKVERTSIGYDWKTTTLER